MCMMGTSMNFLYFFFDGFSEKLMQTHKQTKTNTTPTPTGEGNESIINNS